MALLVACVGFDLNVQRSPEPRERPVPEPLRAEAPPTLEPTEMAGIQRATGLDPHLYYAASEKLWYRYWGRRWFQAFDWNGHWFPPERVPEALREGAIVRSEDASGSTQDAPRRELPTIPELDREIEDYDD